MFKYLKWVKSKDPTVKNIFDVLFFCDGIKLIWYYRIAHFLYYKKLKYVARIISQIAKKKYCAEIHPACFIGKRVFIDHALGIVIGATSIIGDDCIIYHGVTIGSKDISLIKRHPTIGNNVLIGAGSIILGNVCIGDNTKIGAGSIVVEDILPNSVVICQKAKQIVNSDCE